MRALAAAALATLAVIAAGCGATSSGVARGSDLGGDGASLAPPDTIVFAALNTDLGSEQWQRFDALTQAFPARAKLLDKLNAELQQHGLTWKDDVAPALGTEVDVAELGRSEAVVFTKPDDIGKLHSLVDKLSTAKEHYSVEQVDGWSVVADSQELFDKVRTALSGTSLADQSAFKSAWSQVGGDALARAYANGEEFASMPRRVTPLTAVVGNANWLAARISAEGDALRAELVTHSKTALPNDVQQALLGDVPSGAALAVAFHGSRDLVRRLASANVGKRLPLAQLAPLAGGDGVLYVRSQGLIPEVALELVPKNPQAELARVKAALARVGAALGPIKLTAQLSNGKLVISDGPAATAALHGGPKLVGDRSYKDAIAAAGVPAKTTFLAYADVTALTPLIQLAAPALTGHASDPALADNLSHVGTVVVWGTSSGSTGRVQAWIHPR